MNTIDCTRVALFTTVQVHLFTWLLNMPSDAHLAMLVMDEMIWSHSVASLVLWVSTSQTCKISLMLSSKRLLCPHFVQAGPHIECCWCLCFSPGWFGNVTWIRWLSCSRFFCCCCWSRLWYALWRAVGLLARSASKFLFRNLLPWSGLLYRMVS